MKVILGSVLTIIAAGVALADEAPGSYEAAKAIWSRNRESKDYQGYAIEFAQFNNHFHLDEKDGCYALAPGSVNLMLVISQPKNSEFAVIERVLADVDSEKARCFEKSYSGVQVKAPPFFPFVLQMGMK